MEIKATLGDDSIVKEKLEKLNSRHSKAIKKERNAQIMYFTAIVIMAIGLFVFDMPIIIFWIVSMIIMAVANHYITKTAQAMGRLVGYLDGSSDTMIELTFQKARKDFMKAIDEHKEQEAKKEEIKKPAPKKSVKK